jgi:tetratricopeptide (TPR) repeat protein
MSCLTPQVLGSYEAQILEGAEKDRVALHLAGCAACRARREELLDVLASLGEKEAPSEIAPQPTTWSAIDARLAATPTLEVSVACSFCKGKLVRAEAVYCAACLAPHHEDCWDEHGACAACSATTLVRAELRVGRRPKPAWRKTLLVAALVGGSVAAWSDWNRRRSSDVLDAVEGERPRQRFSPPAPVPAPTLPPPAPAPKVEIAPVWSAMGSEEYRQLVESGRAKAEAGDPDGAIDDLTLAIDFDPSLPIAYDERGLAEMRAKKLPEAIKDFDLVIRRHAEYAQADLHLGRAYEWTLDEDSADFAYADVATIDVATDLERARALAGRARILALRSNRVDVLSELDRRDREQKAAEGSVPGHMALGDLVAEGGAVRAKRAAQACALYEQALKLDPNLVEALLGRARLAFAMGAPEDAAPFLARARESATGRELAQARCLEGRLQLLKKDWDRAIATFESALASDPGSAFAFAGLAHAYLGRDGDSSPEARGLLARARAIVAPANDPELAVLKSTGDEGVENAVRSRKIESYALARRCFARLIDRNPFDARSYVKRARAAAQWHDWDFALRDLDAALKADPFCGEAYTVRGFLLARDLPTERDERTFRPLRVRAASSAINDFEKAVELSAVVDLLEPRYGLALAWSNMGTFSADRALEEVDKALARIPDDLPDHTDDERFDLDRVMTAIDCDGLAHRLSSKKAFEPSLASRALLAAARARSAGQELENRRQYTRAIERFDRATALDPRDADSIYDRGTCYMKVGNFLPGIFDFSRALELNPRFADQFYSKVYQVSYVVDLNRVIAELNKIVGEFPDVAHVVFLRGFFYVAKTEFKKYDRKDLELGIADFDRTLELAPKHVSAQLYRGFLRYKLGLIATGDERRAAFEAALADLAAAEDLDPQGGVSHFLRAMVWSVRSSDAEGAEKTSCIDRAVKELQVSIEEKAFKGFDRIKNDKGFDAIRNDPRVLKLIEGK